MTGQLPDKINDICESVYLKCFMEPSKNLVSPRSAPLEAVYLKALL